MRPGFFSLLAIASLVLACTTRADACSVPVFRYALERWQPDLFQAIVVHRGALNSEQKKLVDAFDRSRGKNMANVELVTVDLDDSPPPELLTLIKKQDAADLAARMTALGTLRAGDMPTIRKIAEGKVVPQFSEDGWDVIAHEEV